MKKMLCLLCALLVLTGGVCHSADYMYFSSGEMTQTIDGSTVCKLGDCYYATDAQGRLYTTQIFTDWLQVTSAPTGARIVTDKRADADKLLVYAAGTLYVSYDGAVFTAAETFAADAVLRYTCGLYTAVSKTESGYVLRYSFDGLGWYDFSQTLTASTFSVLRVNENKFVLGSIATENGVCDALLDASAPQSIYFFSGLVYDLVSDTLVDSPNYTGAKLIYADKTTKDNFLYIYRSEAGNSYKYEVVRLNADRSMKNMSAVTADKTMQMYVYNDTLCLAQNDKSLNLINTGDAWHQVSDAIAFPALHQAYDFGNGIFFDYAYTNQYYVRSNESYPIAADGVEVILNNSYLAFDSAPQIMSSRTMVPVRAISEALGSMVSFNDATRQICIQKDGVELYMTIGSSQAYKCLPDGSVVHMTLDVSPVIANERTLVPVRFVCESLDLTADWNGETKTVVLK